jgi:hypothetical protein
VTALKKNLGIGFLLRSCTRLSCKTNERDPRCPRLAAPRTAAAVIPRFIVDAPIRRQHVYWPKVVSSGARIPPPFACGQLRSARGLCPRAVFFQVSMIDSRSTKFILTALTRTGLTESGEQ